MLHSHQNMFLIIQYQVGNWMFLNIELIQILNLECLKEHIHRKNDSVDKDQKMQLITYRKHIMRLQ